MAGLFVKHGKSGENRKWRPRLDLNQDMQVCTPPRSHFRHKALTDRLAPMRGLVVKEW